ncbi:hypothetical protein CsatB_014827 [Cannabis sativa]
MATKVSQIHFVLLVLLVSTFLLSSHIEMCQGKTCTAGIGRCSQNCNEECCEVKCWTKFGNSGKGMCYNPGELGNVCLCSYDC